MLFQFTWWLPVIFAHCMIYIHGSTTILINRNEKQCSKSNILIIDHELVFENSGSDAVNMLPNTIIYVKALKYLNIKLRQIYCIKRTWNLR